MDQFVDASMTLSRPTPFSARQSAISATPGETTFSLADLILIKAWADSHDIRMAVCLDPQSADCQGCDEVVAFEADIAALDQLMMWRTGESVHILPLIGQSLRCASVAQALEHLLPAQPVTLTDITATAWPAGKGGTRQAVTTK
jgi:hypothetical protein